MPYYRTTVADDARPVMIYGTDNGVNFRSAMTELSFRTKPPTRGQASLVADSVAEPYSWFEEYQDLKQRATSRTHPEMASLFQKDRGHAWDSFKSSYVGQDLSGTMVYRGNPSSPNTKSCVNMIPRTVAAVTAGVFVNDQTLASDVELTNYGALAYGRAAPLADEFSLPAFVGELREGLPSLIPALFLQRRGEWASRLKASTNKARQAGRDYLNVQFGWLPMLNDVRALATALATATVAITQSSQSHRERSEPQIDTTSIFDAGLRGDWACRPAYLDTSRFPNSLVGTNSLSANIVKGSFYLIQRYESRMWFEGNFVRLPKVGSKLDTYMDRFDGLMRTDLTPSDLWQLAPWSWLVDWFLDIGGAIESWQSATSNRILSTYAYAMRSEKRTTSVFVSNIASNHADFTWNGPKSIFGQYVVTRKRRVRANPFGFILNPTVALNAGQLAILAALGLTNIRR